MKLKKVFPPSYILLAVEALSVNLDCVAFDHAYIYSMAKNEWEHYIAKIIFL